MITQEKAQIQPITSEDTSKKEIRKQIKHISRKLGVTGGVFNSCMHPLADVFKLLNKDRLSTAWKRILKRTLVYAFKMF